MKKIYYVIAVLIVLSVSVIGITYSFEYTDNHSAVFSLIGPEVLYIDVNSTYEEYGIKATYNNVDVSNDVIIDSSNVNTSVLGEYKVKYQLGDEYVYRIVKVIDKEEPVITLFGGEEVYILLGGKYIEAGYSVEDNYDTDLYDKVVISGNVDINTEGEYILKYSVTDNSGNTGSIDRKIIVKKAEITLGNTYNRVNASSYNVYLYPNTVIVNKFTNEGIYYEGYIRNVSDNYKIILRREDNKAEYFYNMEITKNNYYKGNINLTNVANGKYNVYIKGTNEERLMNKLDMYTKIIRAHVGDKLVTVSYEEDLVNILVEDFEYKYDIVIDPGHGGSDIGASNGILAEKDLNLFISNYEKCRYEAMGYRVYMVRYDDSLGEMLGSASMDPLDRRGLTIGYYGAVSRISYSNHHNGSIDTGRHGFEILVSNDITAKDLAPELSLYNKFMNLYEINDDELRMYSRHYDTGETFNKANGEIYDYKNFYSVIRNPYELYNVKNVIYEPIYLSNASDFNWYYASRNFITVSELKIQEYVKYMGGIYKHDNGKCVG